MPRLILASGSPRRAEILSKIGLKFEVVKSDVPELDGRHAKALTARELVLANATRKASATTPLVQEQDTILAADTEVYLDGRIFGKPASRIEAEDMLRTLSDKTHEVWTGVVLMRNNQLIASAATLSTVTFKKLSSEGITKYLSLVNCMDKAGAYAVQEHGEKIIKKITGSLTNIMGLPEHTIRNWLHQKII